MFLQSEMRRLMSMAFLMVILFMIIQSSRGPGNRRLLVGREGNKDQVVREIDEEASDQLERVPASPKSNADAPTAKTATGHSTVAFAQANGNLPDGSAPAPKSALNSPTPSPPPPGIAASKDDAPSTTPNKASPSTATPAFPFRSNPVPTGATPQAPADEQPAARQPAPDAAANTIPPANGPTDEDPDEAASAKEDLEYVDDGSLGIGKPEMVAYERMLRWVTNQSYDRLAARAEFKKLNHAQIVAAANDRRGKLFHFKLHVRSMIRYEDKVNFYNSEDDPHEPVYVYDLWGDTGESRGRLYQLVVYEPPAGMPMGDTINEDVEFAGYFFKLQGYEPGKAKPGAPPELAPTFIGRIRWLERPPAVFFHQADLWWIATLGGGVLLILLVFFAWLFVFRKGRPNVAQLSMDMAIPSVVSIDEWLEHPEHGRDTDGQDTRTTDEAQDTEIEPSPTTNGHGNGHARLFSNRPDGGPS